MSNFDHKNSWKDSKEVFEKQLTLNLNQIKNGDYPPHWVSDLQLLSSIRFNSLYEICCGVGSFYKVMSDNFDNIKYKGSDYSEYAIEIAKKQWGDVFEVKNLYDLTLEDVKIYDIIYMSGVVDIIPDEKLIKFILSLNVKYILISRINLTELETSCKTYKAYNIIETYDYIININRFKTDINSSNYEIINQINKSILLKRK